MQEEPLEGETRPSEYYIPHEEFSGTPPRRSDQDIRRDIETALFYDDLVRSYEVQVAVQDGIVTLAGTVDSDTALTRALRDAKTVPGVRDIQNNLQVRRS
ncbi:MAG: BON domain-containing protein [Chloroflexota bacterium]|nr:MAG: BON domain-containing protein [Chloroflexota bacterium]